MGEMPALKPTHPFLFFASLLFVLMLAACSRANGTADAAAITPTPVPPTQTPLPPSETPVALAAIINGEPILLEEFNAEVQRYQTAHSALGTFPSEEETRRIVLDDLISQVLLAQGAAEAGFTLDDSALQMRLEALAAQAGGAEALRAWQQAYGYSEDGFRAALRRAIAAAWMRDKIISSVPHTARQVHVRQILLYNEDVAQSYYKQLQAGANFEELAIRVDPITRGDIGWFPRNYLASKEVEYAAFRLEIGAVSEIIKSEAGYHILKVLEVQDDRPLSPDALLALQNRALSDWLAERRRQSTINIHGK